NFYVDELSHFFFSSRRRHTRFSRDWSSDVCSSDLQFFGSPSGEGGIVDQHGYPRLSIAIKAEIADRFFQGEAIKQQHVESGVGKIGRASCRERRSNSVGGE